MCFLEIATYILAFNTRAGKERLNKTKQNKRGSNEELKQKKIMKGDRT